MTKEKNVDEAMWSERRMREEAIERRVGGGNIVHSRRTGVYRGI